MLLSVQALGINRYPLELINDFSRLKLVGSLCSFRPFRWL